MTNNLEDLSTDQIEAELKRRKTLEAEQKKPNQILDPDLTELRRICQEYIDCLHKSSRDDDTYCDDDFDHYIYEVALQTIFGKNIFEWVNRQ